LATPQKVFIVGIGDDGVEGLSARSQQLLSEADMLIGADRALRAVPASKAQRVEVGGDLDAIIQRIEQSPAQKIVMLASGDPLFYGTARFLTERLGKERFEVVPHVSSMQLAFARVKESWDEAYLTNLASQALDVAAEKIRTSEKVGIFTTEQHSPAAVAQALLDRKIDYFSAYVCENLGSPDERVTQGDLSEIASHKFGPLNVMILVRKPDVPDRPTSMVGTRLFGNPDESFLQSQPKRGLLTPAEVRAVALAELDLGPSSIVWDVGAGSGSVAIEAARLAASGQVFAIEMDPEDHALIIANAERFAVKNLVPVLGQAPDCWEKLPLPDAIFVGGSGRQVSHIVELAYARLKPGGRIVANVGSIESLNAVQQVLVKLGSDPAVWMINLARGVQQIDRMRFEAMNPTFLVGGVRK
jgi:precorrin-6B C5,15-methyltransferase / cobalt-precorrin-6B C5,C15-methyltransferase